MSGYAYLAGVAGAALGIVAGIAQWAFGTEIPEWTGNKLHPVQLGIITIALNLIALAAVVFAHRNPTISPRARVLLAVAACGYGLLHDCWPAVVRAWAVTDHRRRSSVRRIAWRAAEQRVS